MDEKTAKDEYVDNPNMSFDAETKHDAIEKQDYERTICGNIDFASCSPRFCQECDGNITL